jgi:hypothetical protein
MIRVLRAALPLLTLSLPVTACAVLLGGPAPVGYQAAALQVAAGAPATEVVQRLRAAGVDLVLLSAPHDSAWFASVAEGTGLGLSGPGFTARRGFAFLANLELLGDTSLTLDVPGGGRVYLHDALYRVDRDRILDLILVRFDGPDVRAGVRTLFGYIATDVAAHAAVLLAIDADTPALADSAAVLMRAHYAPAAECGNGDRDLAQTGGIRLMLGPAARLTCRNARVLPGSPPGIIANVVVAR